MSDAVALASEQVKSVLTTYFVGTEIEDLLDEATTEVVKSIQHLLETKPKSNNNLGITVMTESASMRTGKDGLPGIPPRRI